MSAAEQTPQQYLASQRQRTLSGRFIQLQDGEGLHSPHADAQKQRYLEQLAAGASVRQACDAVGVDTWRPWTWQRDDSEFAAALEVVMRGAKIPLLESRLDEISQLRTDMPAVVATLARLKALDPEHYAAPERQAPSVTNVTVQVISEAIRGARVVAPAALPLPLTDGAHPPITEETPS